MSQSTHFWIWFRKNEAILFEFSDRLLEGVAEPIWQELAVRMSRLHRSLCYLITDVTVDGRRDFIITASGDSKAIPAVARLYLDAPSLTMWRVLKYRPRRVGDWDLTYEGELVDRDEIEFVLFTRNQRPSLMLFVRNYDSSREDASWYDGALPILVDQLLGEADSMWLAEILLFPWDDPTKAKRYPMRLLPIVFDQMKEKLPAQRE